MARRSILAPALGAVACLASACGAGGKTTPATVTPTTPPSSATPPGPAGQDRAAATPADDDKGILLGETATLPDGTPVATSAEGLTLPTGKTLRLGIGDVEVVADKWAVYPDAQQRFRARALTPRGVPINGSTPVSLTLGDRATSDGWEVRWRGVHGGLVAFEGRHRSAAPKGWTASPDPRGATHEVASENGLLHFEVTLVAALGEPLREGTIEVRGASVERATRATFGTPHGEGLFVFPDGLRVRVERTWMCDYDPDAPCPFGGTYQASALRGDKATSLEIKTRSTRVLGYTLEMGRGSFVVRK